MSDIIIDLSRDSKFDELGLKRLKESYMMPGETSPQERFAYVCKQFGTDKDHSQRLYEYTSKHWLSLLHLYFLLVKQIMVFQFLVIYLG